MRHVFLILVLFAFNLSINAQKLHFTDKYTVGLIKTNQTKSDVKESVNQAKSDFVYHRLEWEINPEIKYIKGKITTYFKSLVPNFTQLEFDLDQALTVDSVFQRNQKINFSHQQNKLIIPLPNELGYNKLDSVTIFYQGEPRTSGFGAFTKSVHNNVPIIWTLSEPYGAMEWWPCKQSLYDKTDSIDIIVSSPKEYRTASNGVLVSELVHNDIRIMHWKHRYPIATYLIAIATTNYVSYSDTLRLKDGRIIEILNFVYPENIENAQRITPVTIEIMDLYNNIIGEYPFADEKYGHAQFGWGGGMEHQTMSFMGDFNFELIAHELAHQWFGDYITLGTWQDIWLNEGFATYLTGLAYENLSDRIWWTQWKKLNKTRIITNPDGSVFVNDTTNISTIFSSRLSYSKGAYLLHMLRWILGDQSFFKGIKSYFNDPLVANGFAINQQFVADMETVGDTSLTEFFNDWYYGEGYPVYEAKYDPINSNTLYIELSQNPSHPSVSFFEMPVPIRAYNIEKTDSIDFKLEHTENNQRFIVNPGFKVAEIKIDPDNWLISDTGKIQQTSLLEKNDSLWIFPNPFTEIITISYPAGFQPTDIELFNCSGSLVKTLNSNISTFYFSDLSNGIYILRAKSKEEVIQQTIIKQ